MHINCFWVSGSLKGHGYSNELLKACIKDARQKVISFKSIRIDSREKAKNAPAVWTNYALFYNGEYVTNEILSEKKFLTLAEDMK